MFGLSEKGFKRKRMIDIRNDLETQWKVLFGENSRTDDKSINGKLISLIAYVLSPLWMLAEKVYNNGFIFKAEGNSLSELVRNKLIERRPAEYAEGKITIFGDEGTIVESGFLVSNDDAEYMTTETVEIGETGEVSVPIIALKPGTIGNAMAETVTEIDTPTVGVDEVINNEAISGGRNEETDSELRTRYELSLSASGSPTTNGIRAEILGVAGVLTANVVENRSLETVDGRPGRSFESYVLGGEDEDIAKAIFSRRAAGIQAHGEIIVDITDDAGNTVPIGFTRAEEVDIYMEIEVKTNNEFPLDGNEQIRTAIIEYVGGTDYDGNIYAGLQTGQDVYFTKIIGIIDNVPGVERVIKLDIGTSANDLVSMSDVEINDIQVAMTDYNKVVIK